MHMHAYRRRHHASSAASCISVVQVSVISMDDRQMALMQPHQERMDVLSQSAHIHACHVQTATVFTRRLGPPGKVCRSRGHLAGNHPRTPMSLKLMSTSLALKSYRRSDMSL
jgi:hypothetical protein